MTVIKHDVRKSGGRASSQLTKNILSGKANFISELIQVYKVPENEIRCNIGVSASTIHRWVTQDISQITPENFQKLLSLYCIYYLKKFNKCNQSEV